MITQKEIDALLVNAGEIEKKIKELSEEKNIILIDIEKNKVKKDMYISELKKMGYDEKDLDKKIEELYAETSNGIREIEKKFNGNK